MSRGALVTLESRREDPASRSLLITRQAAALFLRDGIAAVRMTDIAEASGVGVATLYRHYKTKTKLAIRAATFLWQRFNSRIITTIETSEFLELNGADRIAMLFKEYRDGLDAHPEFIRFLDEFDHLLLAEGVSSKGQSPEGQSSKGRSPEGQSSKGRSPEGQSSKGQSSKNPYSKDLEKYGRTVDSFYVLFEDSYRLGCQDGSIKRHLDFPVFYRTVAHAMMSIAQKLARGEIIPSDDFSNGSSELDCIVLMARCTLGIADFDLD